MEDQPDTKETQEFKTDPAQLERARRAGTIGGRAALTGESSQPPDEAEISRTDEDSPVESGSESDAPEDIK